MNTKLARLWIPDLICLDASACSGDERVLVIATTIGSHSAGPWDGNTAAIADQPDVYIQGSICIRNDLRRVPR